MRCPHCIDFSRGATRLVILAAVLLGAGCAGAPERGPDPAAATATVPTEVEPAVLERYEQAVALLEAGDLEGAESLLQRFVADHPGYPGAHTNLAIVYRQTNREADAERALGRALALAPDYAPALNQLGVIHREHGRFAEAEAAYLKAVTAQPGYALAHFNLGVLNDLYLGRPDEALSHYEQYQALTDGNDETVAMWIVDIRRRLGVSTQSARVD